MGERSASDLVAANRATELFQQEEAKEAIAARTEAEVCMSFQHQSSMSREKVTKLQHVAEASWLENEELASELAQARDDAKRHARNATEFRAELVATKRELAKQRHAERDLQQAVDEVETLSAKLSRAQRGREVAEHEVKQGQSRQATLERQVRDLQTRMTAERLARRDREPSARREASADTWLFSDQQGLFTAGTRPSSGKASPSPSNVATGVQPVRRNTPGDVSSALGFASDAATNARTPSPISAAPGIGRSHSLGVLSGPGGPDCDATDPQGCAAQTPNGAATCDAFGTLRTSPYGASSHPPRPPQASAPRMGWATHARSRGDGTPERHGDVQYSPEAGSSSIDRVIR